MGEPMTSPSNPNIPTLSPYPNRVPDVCSECGSEDIQFEMWVAINTTLRAENGEEWGQICGDTGNDEVWCEDCQEHRYSVPKPDFQPPTKD